MLQELHFPGVQANKKTGRFGSGKIPQAIKVVRINYNLGYSVKGETKMKKGE